MSVYDEKMDKFSFITSNSGKPVKLKVETHYGTLVSVALKKESTITVHEDEEKEIGNNGDLKGKTMIFAGVSGNPDNGQIKIIHTISQQDGNTISYTFPDDYTGSPNFNNSDKQPSYFFYVKFN